MTSAVCLCYLCGEQPLRLGGVGAVEAGGRGPREGRLLETGGRGRRQGVTRLALTLLLSGLARPLGTEVTPVLELSRRRHLPGHSWQ